MRARKTIVRTVDTIDVFNRARQPIIAGQSRAGNVRLINRVNQVAHQQPDIKVGKCLEIDATIWKEGSLTANIRPSYATSMFYALSCVHLIYIVYTWHSKQ